MITDWYHKSSDSRRILNFMSNHPIHQKRLMIFFLTDKVILLSDPNFHEINLKLLFNILKENLYPTDLIQLNITKRINRINNNDSNTNMDQ